MDRKGRINYRFCLLANNRPLIHGTSVLGLYQGRPSYRFRTFAGNALVSSSFYRRIIGINGLDFSLDIRNFHRIGSDHHNPNIFSEIVRTVSLLHRCNVIFNASVYCAHGGVRAIASSGFLSLLVDGNT